MRFIIVITQFQVTIATNCLTLTPMNVTYVVGHEERAAFVSVYRLCPVSTGGYVKCSTLQ
jgi:hypothetical protein